MKIIFIKYRYLIFLFLLAFISFVLRWYNLTFQSYWLDEIVSAQISDPENRIQTVYFDTLEGGPPFYQILLWGWFKIFGFTEVAGRSLSVIFGALSPIALYGLGKEMFNRKVGVISAVILSLNQFSIFYSQETRSYSLLLFLSIVSIFLFFKFLKKSQNSIFICYLFVTGLTFFTHYFGFFILLSQLIFVIFFKRDWLVNNKFFFLVGFFFFALLILPLSENIFKLSNLRDFWVSKPKWNFWIFYFHLYFKSKILSVIFAILICFTIWKMFRMRGAHKERYYFLILLILTTFGLAYFRSVFSTPLLTARNTIIVLPSIILLVSLGIFYLRNKIWQYFLIGIIIINSAGFLIQSSYYNRIEKQNWREVLIEVKKEKASTTYYDVVFFGTYYHTYSKLLDLGMEIKTKEEFYEDLQSKMLPSRFWVLDAHGENIKNIDFLKDKRFEEEKRIQKRNAAAILIRFK